MKHLKLSQYEFNKFEALSKLERTTKEAEEAEKAAKAAQEVEDAAAAGKKVKGITEADKEVAKNPFKNKPGLEKIAERSTSEEAKAIKKAVSDFIKENPGRIAATGLSATAFEGYCIVKGHIDPLDCLFDLTERTSNAAGNVVGNAFKGLAKSLGVPSWAVPAFLAVLILVLVFKLF